MGNLKFRIVEFTDFGHIKHPRVASLNLIYPIVIVVYLCVTNFMLNIWLVAYMQIFLLQVREAGDISKWKRELKVFEKLLSHSRNSFVPWVTRYEQKPS